jgi:nucleoside-diphosphate-sugar epimerase
MDGCDGVVHAASVYSLDRRAAGEIRRVNVDGTRIVLDAACVLGLDRIVHVSSYVALMSPEGNVPGPDSPVGHPPGTYVRSKADSERVARRFQDEGAPVVITYPGAVWGPYDPHWGDGPQLVAGILKRHFPMVSPGGFPIVDVRDVAAAHRAIMESPGAADRFMVTGHRMAFAATITMIAERTGRSIPFVTVPAWCLAPAAYLADIVQPILPVRIPISLEGFRLLAWDARPDDSRTRDRLNIRYRDPEVTCDDMIRWMVESGGMPASLAGRLGNAPRGG